jgi:hypothetical protein
LTPIQHGRNFASALAIVRTADGLWRLAFAALLLGFSARAVAQAPATTPSPAPATTPSPAPAEAAAEAPPPEQGEPAPGAELDEAARERARETYTNGRQLFDQGKYVEARAAFQEAYDLIPNPIVLISLAEIDLRLGKFDEAVDEFRLYLEKRPDAPERAEVEKKITELEATPTVLILSSDPTGARIVIDGKDTGQVTPAEVPVSRGEHALELSLDGYETTRETLTVRLGSRHELHAAMVQPSPPPAAAEPEPPAPVAVELEEPPTTALWVTGIVGAAGLISGTVLGFMALAERSDFDAEPTEDSADRGERLALFADVAFGVGAMAIVTGAVLYLTSDDEAAPADTAALSVAPAIGRDGAAVIAGMRF